MQLIYRHLPNLQDYPETWQRMKEFTLLRDQDTTDEIWSLEHKPVFTQGQAGKPEHLINPGNIPVLQTDRGGQVTYHGPGQIVVYLMCDLRRLNVGAREMVGLIEKAIVDTLQDYGIEASGDDDARGVYVAGKKIASLGLRISRGCSYHGLALNAEMDLAPFGRINPCGYAGMEMTQLSELVDNPDIEASREKLLQHLASLLKYNEIIRQ